MADPRAVAHIKRGETLFTDLSLWLPTWQDLSDLICVRKNSIQVRKSPGRTNTERLLDSTAPHALELLAASMQGSLTSGSIKWFYYRLRGLLYGTDTEADKWLDDASDTAYDELRTSNWSSETHEFYTDLACIGTAAMFIDRKESKPGQPWQGLRFQTLPPGTYAIDENDEGRVDTLYYKYRKTARQAAQAFGMEALPEQIKKALIEGREPDRSYEFIHAIFPRTDRWRDAGATATAGKDKPWASLHIAVEDPTICREGGYEEFPFAVARWTKSSDEKYGRSPGFTMLADIKTLNKLVELKLRALANKVYPPLMVRDNGVLGKVMLKPGGLTIVRDHEAVQPLFTDQGGIEAGMLQEEKLQAAVRRGFFSDQLQLQEGPQMTAYEVQVRYELMQRILGPTLGRLEIEFLGPVNMRVYKLLERAKRIPEPPASLVEKMKELGRGFEIEYEGPLQRAQRLGDVVTIQRFLQLVLPLVEADPEVLDNVDIDEIARVAAKNTGVPARIIRAIQDRDKRRQERRAQQAQQQQAVQGQETAKAAGAAAPALKALMEAQQAGILPQGGLSGQGAVTGGVGR